MPPVHRHSTSACARSVWATQACCRCTTRPLTEWPGANPPTCSRRLLLLHRRHRVVPQTAAAGRQQPQPAPAVQQYLWNDDNEGTGFGWTGAFVGVQGTGRAQLLQAVGAAPVGAALYGTSVATCGRAVVRLLHCYAAPQSRPTARRPTKGLRASGVGMVCSGSLPTCG